MTGPVTLPEGTQTVAQVTARIRAVLRRELSEALWVAGEISGKKARNGRVFFELIDRPDASAPPKAKIRVVCQPAVAQRIGQKLRAAGVRLDDGVPVRVQARLALWPQAGVYQLEMLDVDAAWTLSQQIANRELLLAKLRDEGVLDANRRLPLPELPIRVALITSPGSHAEADFRHTLETSGFGFQVTVFPSLVQGVNAPRQVVAAIQAVREHHRATRWRPDIVVCVRGGGARSDLAAWDDPDVARAIAASAYPVLVAVGHELDRSVADEAAAVSVKTPTAAAQWLVDAVGRRLAGIDTAVARLERRAAARCDQVIGRLDVLAGRTARAVAVSLTSLEQRVAAAAARAGPAAQVRLGDAERDATAASARAATAAVRSVERAEGAVALAAARAQAADPRRILARGFSVTRTADGALVRSPQDVPPGTALVTVVAGGRVHSTAR